MTTVVGYVRVSTAGQADSGLGLDAQRAIIAAEASRRDWDLIWRQDAGVSGKTLRRDGLEDALRLLERREASALVVAKLDRLSRSVIDFARLLDAAGRSEFGIVCLDLGVDTTTPTGRLVANVVAAVAEFEREAIAARTREAVWQQRGKAARLAPRDVHEQIVGLARDGVKAPTIARLLDADGVPTPNGAVCWWPSTVRRMIKSARSQGLIA